MVQELLGKIDEIVETGSLEYLNNLKKEFPVDYDALMAVEGLGPRSIKQLYNELGIKESSYASKKKMLKDTGSEDLKEWAIKPRKKYS